jgi:tetratricopeptide (TPR) repeat protein
VDLQFEESEIPVAADLSADVGAVSLGPEFQLDTTVLDQVFAELAPEEAPRTAPAEEDPFALARDLLDKGMLEAATAEVSQVIRRGGDVAAGTVLLGRIFARRGLHGEALERFRAALIDRPDDADLLVGLAEALIALGRGETHGGGRASRGHRARERRRARRASPRSPAHRRPQRRTIRRGGGGPETARARRPLMLVGSIAREGSDREAAREAYRAALQLDAGLVQAWYELGTVEEELGQPLEARTAYREAVRLLPTHLEATLALAFALRREGNSDEAVNLLVDYLLAEPLALPALTLLGQSLLDARRPGEAVTALKRVLLYVPDDLAALFHLGVAWARLRQYEDAVAAWERVVDVNPSGPLAATARQHARSARDLSQILHAGAGA